MDFRVRQATLSDWELVAELRIRMLEEHRGAPIEPDFAKANCDWIKACMERDVYSAWFAEDDGGILGVVGLRNRDASPRPTDPVGREAYVQNLYVEPRARRRGIARALMREVLTFCKDHGYDRIALRASDKGRSLYEQLGFVPDTQMIYRPAEALTPTDS